MSTGGDHKSARVDGGKKMLNSYRYKIKARTAVLGRGGGGGGSIT